MSFLVRYLSVRYWLRHRGAFLLASLGVALGITVFVAMQVANHSVLAAFSASLDAVTGKANLQIRGGSNGLPESVFVSLKRHPDKRIRAAAPVVGRTLRSPNLKTSVLVLGIDLISESRFREHRFALNPSSPEDSFPQVSPLRFMIDPRAAVIGREFARRHHLKKGSAVELDSGIRRSRFQVFAIIDDGELGQAYGGDFVLLDIAAAQEATSMVGRLTRIDLIANEPELDNVSTALRSRLPPDAQVQRPAQRGLQVSTMLAAFQLNLTAMSCIALFVGAFLIYNAIATSVVRRRTEVGILRAIGAGRRQIVRMFLVEAGIVGLTGSIAGMLLGIYLARFALHAVSTTVSTLYIAVNAREIFVPLWLWWGAPLGGALLAVAAAVPAALEAAGTPPRAALLRVTVEQGARRFARPLALAGTFLLLTAGLLCLPAISEKTPLAGFGGAFCTLAGFAFWTPLLTIGGSFLWQRATGPFAGIESNLAGLYLQRALNRSSLVIAALMVSLAMTIGLAIMVRSFRATLAEWVNNTINADAFIAPASGLEGDFGAGLPHEFVDYVARQPEVRLFATIRYAECEFHDMPLNILAYTMPDLLTGDRVIRFVETKGSEVETRRSFVAGQGILVSERCKSILKINAGNTLTLPSPTGPAQLHVLGVFYDYNPNNIVYMPRQLYLKYWRDDHTDGMSLYLNEGFSSEALRDRLQQRFGNRYQFSYIPNKVIRAQVFRTFDQTFAVTYALQLIALVVAIVGIFDTLTSLLLERGREIATLRAMGASPRQVRKMIYVEFGLIGLFSWLIGTMAGLALAWQLIFVINQRFFGWTIFWTMPLEVLLQALLLALVAALAAGIIPSHFAVRSGIAEKLQME